MPEDMKVLLQEIKEGVTEAVVPAVTKDVMEKIQKQIAEVKVKVEDADERKAVQKEQTAKIFRDMYSEIEAGSKLVVKDLTTGGTNSGDEIVPEYFNSEVLRVQEKFGVARRNARVVPMPGKEVSWPTLGSVIVQRVDEKDVIPAVSPTTDGVKLTAKKLAAIIPMTRELLRDTNVAIVDALAALAGEAIAKAEDQWAFLGLAGGEGIFQHTDVPEHVLSPGKTSYEDADFADLLAMLNLIDEDALDGMKWYMSFAQFNAFRAIVSSNDDRHIFQAPGAGMPPTLWNLPTEFTKVMPRPTDANEEGQQAGNPFLALANLSWLLFGQRDAYELEMSREATVTSTDGETTLNLWERDMVAIRVMERIDIQLSEANRAFARMVTAEDLS